MSYAMVAACFPQTGEDGEHFTTLPATGVSVVLSYRDGKLAGILSLSDDKKRVFLIVNPAFRRQGVGTALWVAARGKWGLKREDQQSNEIAEAGFDALAVRES